MRKNQVKGLMYDILDFMGYKNPLEYSSINKKIEVNLLTKEVLGTADEDISKFYHEKIDWFQKRVKKLAGLNDFKEAKILVQNNTEKIIITFKSEHFSDKRVFGMELNKIAKRFKSYKKEKKR